MSWAAGRGAWAAFLEFLGAHASAGGEAASTDRMRRPGGGAGGSGGVGPTSPLFVDWRGSAPRDGRGARSRRSTASGRGASPTFARTKGRPRPSAVASTRCASPERRHAPSHGCRRLAAVRQKRMSAHRGRRGPWACIAAPLLDEDRAAAPRVVALERWGYCGLWRKRL
jgi:hypothetical protein